MQNLSPEETHELNGKVIEHWIRVRQALEQPYKPALDAGETNADRTRKLEEITTHIRSFHAKSLQVGDTKLEISMNELRELARQNNHKYALLIIERLQPAAKPPADSLECVM